MPENREDETLRINHRRVWTSGMAFGLFTFLLAGLFLGCEKNAGDALNTSYAGILRYVPAGSFQREPNPEKVSVVSGFWMGQYEITRNQYKALFGAEPTGSTSSNGATYSSGDEDPVQEVNWYQAITFCNKLSLAEGLTPVYSVRNVDFVTLTFQEIPRNSDSRWDNADSNWGANGYRLPTELEWMWAAMGADIENPGLTNTTGYLKTFAGSTGTNPREDYVVFGFFTQEEGSTKIERSNPVGSKLPNELGIYDLSGNVWEWCWDWYGDNGTWPNYSIEASVSNYRGAQIGTHRVLRGGSWIQESFHTAVAYREHFFPKHQFSGLGLRVVRN